MMTTDCLLAVTEGRLHHKRSGATFVVKAKVFRGVAADPVEISYSHTFRPAPDSGFWYSDGHSSAQSLDEAQTLILDWFAQLEDSFEIEPWDDIS